MARAFGEGADRREPAVSPSVASRAIMGRAYNAGTSLSTVWKNQDGASPHVGPDPGIRSAITGGVRKA